MSTMRSDSIEIVASVSRSTEHRCVAGWCQADRVAFGSFETWIVCNLHGNSDWMSFHKELCISKWWFGLLWLSKICAARSKNGPPHDFVLHRVQVVALMDHELV